MPVSTEWSQFQYSAPEPSVAACNVVVSFLQLFIMKTSAHEFPLLAGVHNKKFTTRLNSCTDTNKVDSYTHDLFQARQTRKCHH